MHESTDRERKTELNEVLLFCITVVQQDLHNPLKSAYHTVVDEEEWVGHVDGVHKTGILSVPLALSKRSAEFLAVKLLAP